MPLPNNWPSRDEIEQLQNEEFRRAEACDEEADPICDCGEPGYACCCEELAKKLGYWYEGSDYDD